MSERMDHAKAADDLMRRLALHPAPEDNLDVEWGFREAQIHATLALVEQQRITNLIALADHATERWGAYAGEAGGLGTLFSYGESPESNMRIRSGVREALGLT